MHRTQMLLPVWLNSFIDEASSKCKVSKGEIIRGMLCFGILEALNTKGYQVGDLKTLKQNFCKASENKTDIDPMEIHRYHEDLFFETRKAIEAWTSENK